MFIWEQIKKSATMAWAWFCGLISSVMLAFFSAVELLELPEVKQQVVSFLNLNKPGWVMAYGLIIAIGSGMARMRTLK